MRGTPCRRPPSIARGRALRCALDAPVRQMPLSIVGRRPRSQTRSSSLGFALLAQASWASPRSLIRRPPQVPRCAVHRAVGRPQSLADAPFGPGLRPARSYGGLRRFHDARYTVPSAALNRSRTRPSGLGFAPLAHSLRSSSPFVNIQVRVMCSTSVSRLMFGGNTANGADISTIFTAAASRTL